MRPVHLRRVSLPLVVLLMVSAGCASTGADSDQGASSVPVASSTSTTETTVFVPSTSATFPAPDIELAGSQLIDPYDVTLAELSAYEAPDFEGYLGIVVGANVGQYGSFVIAVPDGWLWWTLGADPAPFIAEVANKDERYSEAAAEVLLEADREFDPNSATRPWLQAAFMDPSADYLVMVMIGLVDGADHDLAFLVDTTRETYEAGGAQILRLESFESGDSGSVESTALLPNDATLERRIQHQRLVFDAANLWTWSVLCDIHESGNDLSSDECWMVLRSFSPFGYLTAP